MDFIFSFIVVIVLIALFPSLRSWIDGGSKGFKEYKKQKNKNNF